MLTCRRVDIEITTDYKIDPQSYKNKNINRRNIGKSTPLSNCFELPICAHKCVISTSAVQLG